MCGGRIYGRVEPNSALKLWQNGPEGQSIHGYHGQRAGDNPGSTNGLRGRKRDLTEGGIREPGLLEWPRMIKKNLVTNFPAATFDYKPTVLDILGIEPPSGWPLDGTSLVPLIKGEVTIRPDAHAMGWVWGMVYGNRNRTGVCGTWLNERAQLADTPASRLRADGNEIEAWEPPIGEDAEMFNPDTSSQPNQQVWMEQQYKLFGCNNYDGGDVRYFLYDIMNDPAEMNDLAAKMPAKVATMRQSLAHWIASVKISRGPAETNCAALGPSPSPFPPSDSPFKPVLGATNCTWKADVTMPGSRPVFAKGISTQEDCCATCFNTSWCVSAIFQHELQSCNMHSLADDVPMRPGHDIGCVTGRHA
eukprot:SAG11_NODE_2451_length_3346_cov_3.959347_3_plen_361_part_00